MAERLDDRLEALLEVAAKTRAGEQRPRIERVDFGALQLLGHVFGEKTRREPLGHRRLADARFSDEHRVVLAPPAEHFDRPLQLVGTSDERIEQTAPGALREVETVRRQRVTR